MVEVTNARGTDDQCGLRANQRSLRILSPSQSRRQVVAGEEPYMPTSTRPNHRQTKAQSSPASEARELLEQEKEMTGDLTEYLANYARQNPGTAALTCLAIGFVLGWKLKPW
ncbi:MAG TPA: hypothetical protein VHY91_14725 [Pirellulales bacterium]|jgi:hypothetical protein|nr:hypothetical protein [Pirellulales bacterium]